MGIKVAVAGAKGRMGSQVVESIIEENNMELVAGFDPSGVGEEIAPGVKISSPDEMDNMLKEVKPDVFVDFTNATAAVENVKVASRNKVKLVVGTTGFSEAELKEMENAIKDHVPAIISPNFSIGVNIFWKLIEEAARHLRAYRYHVEIIEMHHSHKKDAPSGTAVKAAEIISNYLDAEGGKKTAFVYGRQGITGERTDDEIGIHAVRAGDIVGDHIVLYAGKGERLEITHRAHSREAFAQGAIKAIEWINRKEKSGIYSMEEMMKELEEG
ncbi:MAG: 4-hydroxy-tetrahydrodipicolinate reductase [Methanophagales archaeon]|nr:4-hydroxy-tetrahydrodipicolinate reductase [Methanophagales archaeon]